MGATQRCVYDMGRKRRIATLLNLAQNPCRSEPARDCGGSGGIDVGCAAVIASRLAPTGLCENLS
ncbi:hypothetical protein DKY63_17640 [Pseudomonas putida]|uniref:Uncharacterized protein n=1 Tax=Pseudomonas putida TaxID=303 RepID=A0A2Z4RKE9_PSEPU|nr:hypothetical protein DKY63_17640 [Pseudomonas putida]